MLPHELPQSDTTSEETLYWFVYGEVPRLTHPALSWKFTQHGYSQVQELIAFNPTSFSLQQSNRLVIRIFLFYFLWSGKVAIINVTMVLQISTFVHILDRKYHLSTYHISLILFSSTIWRFHLRFYLIWNFLAISSKILLFMFQGFGTRAHYFCANFQQIAKKNVACDASEVN